MTDKIRKFIDLLDRKTRTRLRNMLKSLRENPFTESADTKKLKGFRDNVYRLRLGTIRIIYEIVETNIVIIDIDYRGNIY
jgi:mRNA interferase RelE/StbE